jgi:hypothetical protein
VNKDVVSADGMGTGNSEGDSPTTGFLMDAIIAAGELIPQRSHLPRFSALAKFGFEDAVLEGLSTHLSRVDAIGSLVGRHIEGFE